MIVFWKEWYQDHEKTLLPGNPLIRANKTKSELMDNSTTPAVNSSRRFKEEILNRFNLTL